MILIASSTAIAWHTNEDPRVASDFADGYLNRAFALTRDTNVGGSGTDDGRRIGEAIANTVLADNPHALILTDDLEANLIILFSGKPGNFVVPNSHQFNQFVDNPVGNVQYILVPESRTENLILKQYPGLISEGEPFVTLLATYQESSGARHLWLLYRVDAPTATREST